jgi:hypothetical protein
LEPQAAEAMEAEEGRRAAEEGRAKKRKRAKEVSALSLGIEQWRQTRSVAGAPPGESESDDANGADRGTHVVSDSTKGKGPLIPDSGGGSHNNWNISYWRRIRRRWRS